MSERAKHLLQTSQMNAFVELEDGRLPPVDVELAPPIDDTTVPPLTPVQPSVDLDLCLEAMCFANLSWSANICPQTGHG